ncbi:MAG: cysteine-rich CWC family protein [Bacteroidetes bacterium]|nr:cysteine-rich CWC family protein [Bacteroidota bacterium]
MCKHETKECPRCSRPFECKVGDVGHCQCNGISLSMEEKAFIEERYNDCLCRECLLELKQRTKLFMEKYFHRG